MVAVAENRLACYLQVKSEVDTQMAQIHERVQNVKCIIKENVQSDENLSGVLTREETLYLECIEIKHVQLENLMRQDEAHWAENLEIIKRQAQEIQDEIKTFLAQQQEQLQSMINRSLSMSRVSSAIAVIKPKFTLRKLPMWGQQVHADQINFDWPTEEMTKDMSQDVFLKSIEFKTYGY